MNTASRPSRDNDKIERITSPGLIAGYLRRLVEAHSLLMATIPGHKDIYTTIIIGLDEKSNSLLLDKLHPEAGHLAVLENRQVRVRAQHNGVEMGFLMQLERLVGEADNPAYLGPLPAELQYHQRRAAYRAQIGVGNEITVMLTEEDERVIEATLFNISTGGVCLTLPTEMKKRFRQFSILPSCRFNTPDEQEIDCQVEVRNLNETDDRKHIHVGMRFVDLERQQQRHIQRFVLSLEREQIKRTR